MHNKVVAIMVTYHPNISVLEKNIQCILPQVDAFFLFDNGSTNVDQIKEIQQRNNFNAIFNSENVGLGKAYNEILDRTFHLYEYFVTFDQDTSILPESIRTLTDLLNNNPTIGVVGPVFSRESSSVNSKGNIILKHAIIQSCAVFRSEAAIKTGRFNESYFIDSVDFEYCLRMIITGYKVALFDGVKVKHDIGVEKKSFGIKYYSHNKIRNYYIARNHMEITKNYLSLFPAFVIKKNIFFILHVGKVLFLERDREKLRYLWKGIKNDSL